MSNEISVNSMSIEELIGKIKGTEEFKILEKYLRENPEESERIKSAMNVDLSHQNVEKIQIQHEQRLKELKNNLK